MLLLFLACFTPQLALHPGWVSTDMGNAPAEALKQLMGGGPAPSPPVTPQQSASGLLALLRTVQPSDNGTFRDWESGVVAW